MAEIETAKLISYVKIDFSTEAELELYINMFEKEGEGFWLQLKEIGLLRWRINSCLLYTSPSPRDGLLSRMPSSA